MHQSSLEKMQAFRERYLSTRVAEELTILDLGSQDVNGSYRPIFEEPQWDYRGVDLAPGKNVDFVLKNPYCWGEVATHSIDVLISGQAMEHIEYFWLTMMEVARVLKPGGLCCVIAPSAGYEHRFPVDCWRFYPDGFAALARFVGLEVLETKTQWDRVGRYTDDSDDWHDSVLVARKPEWSTSAVWIQSVRRSILQWTLKASQPS